LIEGLKRSGVEASLILGDAQLCGDGSGFPHAEHLASHIVSLPIHPELSDRQVDEVIGAIRSN
jgi:dTDP-4-amino-4,6-dideoxygalactose transaminase